jgi:hypothetical protein
MAPSCILGTSAYYHDSPAYFLDELLDHAPATSGISSQETVLMFLVAIVSTRRTTGMIRSAVRG